MYYPQVAGDREPEETGTGRVQVLKDLDEERRAIAAAFPVALERSFPALYGLEILELEPDRVRARVAVREQIKQPMGLVDGGVYASMAEDMASLATGGAVYRDRGQTAVGLSNSTSFLRPITDGIIHAEATRLHRGRTTWLWDVRFHDDHGRLCATSRITLAVRAFGDGGDRRG